MPIINNKRGGPFAQMTKDELTEYCRALYKQHGIKGLSYKSLRKEKSLYANLYRVGLPQKTLLAILGLTDEYAAHNNTVPLVRAGGKITYRWTWGRCIQEAKNIKTEMGFLPPAGWFQVNGRGGLWQAVYSLGRTWESLREAVNDGFAGSSFIESRNGLRWRSHPEASLSNFLYARGVEHARGRKYPEDYAEHASASYAYYDLHFLSASGRWIDVEIWGDKPNGHGEHLYAEKRRQKEKYHTGRDNFLGIEFRCCFSDAELQRILEPFIGVIQPYQFDKPTDRHIETSHWSNADQLLEACRELAQTMPDGKFPTEEWLRKRGKWRNRPGPAYNTMSIYVRLWLGGVRKLRELLGQAHLSTETWDRDSAIEAYRAFCAAHGVTPEQYRHLYRQGDATRDAEISRRATNICAAVRKYAGGSVAAKRELGLHVQRLPRRKIV